MNHNLVVELLNFEHQRELRHQAEQARQSESIGKAYSVKHVRRLVAKLRAELD